MLSRWSQLPKWMRNEKVFHYYRSLNRKRKQLLVKRLMDIVVSFGALTICMPVLVLIACLVNLDSPGGALFLQRRVTRDGRIFEILKFRTMQVNQTGEKITQKDDPRITKVGHFLRRYKLDELPQLLNVLAGDMTLVGTRPEVEEYVRQYDQAMLATLLLPAGLTSKSSLIFYDEASLLSTESQGVSNQYIQQILPRKMKENLAYLENFSIKEDVKIIIKTAFPSGCPGNIANKTAKRS